MTRHRLVGAALAVIALVIVGCGDPKRSAAPSSAAGSPAASATRAHRASGPRRAAALHLPGNPTPRTVRVPILTYHRVHSFATEYTKSIPDETVEPSTFAAEMRALTRAGYRTITQAELFGALFRGRSLPPKPVLVTADDGYADDVTQILPVLRRLRMVATFYVITGRLHEAGFVTPEQVRVLDRAGMDVGAHTRTHADLPSLPLASARKEIAGSRRDLERLLGHPVAAFAYPYGRFDATVVREIRRAGFALAVTTQGGTSESSLAPLTMPRIHVGRAQTAQGVLACLRAAGGCGGGGGG